MRISFFDTETTGFPPGCHLMQIAGSTYHYNPDDGSHHIIKESCALVQTPIEPHEKAYEAHGLTKDMCSHGVTPQLALTWFNKLVETSDIVVAHNLDFDTKVMRALASQLGREHQVIHYQHSVCTMQSSTTICGLTKSNNSPKFPKLSEALLILCQHKLENAHDALEDTRGCAKLFFKLVELNQIQI